MPNNTAPTNISPENPAPAAVPVKESGIPRKKLALIALLILITGSLLFAAVYYFVLQNRFVDERTADYGSVESPFSLTGYTFAEYRIDNTPFKPSLPDYTLSRSDIENLEAFSTSIGGFAGPQLTALEKDNFFVALNTTKFYSDDPDEYTWRSDDWSNLYLTIGGAGMGTSIYDRKPENAVFITSDYLLHVYHRLLEKEFEYIEQTEFYPRLTEMTDALLEQSISGYAQEKDPKNKQSYERLIAYFSVAKSLLDSAQEEFKSHVIVDSKVDTKEAILGNLDGLKAGIPEVSYNMAKAELDLILEQKDITDSPIFGALLKEAQLDFPHDYTQYGPRSHYNKNSVLRTYFRTMMWYGRQNLALKSTELTRDALHIVKVMDQTSQMKNWEDIYIATAFFVGKSDDLGFYEYSEVMADLGVKEISEQSIADIQTKLKEYKGPQVMSSVAVGDAVFGVTKDELQDKTKGFYFMGQRFTPDAFVFTTLTQGDELPDEETGESLPSMTTALMVMSSLGNRAAEPLVNEWIDENAPRSKNVLAKRQALLKDQFEAVPENVWTQNIYWGWLHTIRSLFTENIDKIGYPMFMRNESWHKKDLQASLGSWTELKHDTLLYAKQSYAEMGAGMPEGEIPPVPKGYVEPNTPFLDRLIALSRMTNDGLVNRELLDSTFQGRNEHWLKSLEFLRTIAVKQIQNEEITDDEFENLRTIASTHESVLGPLPSEEQTEGNARSALIADVHTDAAGGKILYEATGIPNYIYVAVKDVNGTRLTKGLVFSYYEFTGPLAERYNDEYWRGINYKEDKSGLPAAPAWTTSLLK